MPDHVYIRLIISPIYSVKPVFLCKRGAEIFDNNTGWCVSKQHSTFYVIRDVCIEGKKTTVQLHRDIMECTPGDDKIIDHRNHNGLDNQITNLRDLSHAQNNQNSTKPINNTSGIKGVFWDTYYKKWRAQIKTNGKRWSKYFTNLDDAKQAIEQKRLELHGDYACHG